VANNEHLMILDRGVEIWNAWRAENRRIRPDLRDCDLRGRKLDGTVMRHASLHNADCTGASFAGADFTSAAMIGANFGHAGLRETILRNADLYKADMNKADLVGANLVGANLNRATLTESVAQRVNLSEANCLGASFHRADLQSAFLLGANLSRANLTGADLRRAELSRAILLGTVVADTNFTDAILGWTTFGGTNLSVAVGLDRVVHEGPSTIGTDVLTLSRGCIPSEFLRGVGLSDEVISMAGSLTHKEQRFHSCFISYSTADQDFADCLYADLQARGVRCWFAPHDIQGGRKIHEQIGEAIQVYDKLLLILSDSSMSSNWVRTEIANARGRETQQKGQMLFPISLVKFGRIKDWKLFDADTGIDSAREIREYFIPDFSNWQDGESYSRTFERLVRDLKADPSGRR
jgi:uncharacterized protein YjbI with pentapeptide repeats